MVIHLILQLSCRLDCRKKMSITILANLRSMDSLEELTTIELLICKNWELMAPWAGCQVKVPMKFIVGDLDLVYNIPGAKEYIHNGGFKKDVPMLDEVVVMEAMEEFSKSEQVKQSNPLNSTSEIANILPNVTSEKEKEKEKENSSNL
ncbi:hypothetical protein HYC85_013023 [Camellia sinensis]|uniref:Uncharacterized protein n=1 Tax=Camellia sinensis TaxID=4442 RepID=A0A7J7HDN7_CAMSI|nr:hypothetical protein HYC85_013023 [Camellia sinensis]